MEDGAPQAIDLTVSFQETTQLSRQKYMNQVSPHNWAERKPSDNTTKVVTDWKALEKAETVEDKADDSAGDPKLNAKLLRDETRFHGNPIGAINTWKTDEQGRQYRDGPMFSKHYRNDSGYRNGRLQLGGN